MTHLEQIQDDIRLGNAVAVECAQFREEVRHRVRPDDPDRIDQIERLLGSIDVAMRRLRSHIGRLVHEPLPSNHEEKLRATSQGLQYERRQLKKMRR